jgi:hypothetical protein
VRANIGGDKQQKTDSSKSNSLTAAAPHCQHSPKSTKKKLLDSRQPKQLAHHPLNKSTSLNTQHAEPASSERAEAREQAKEPCYEAKAARHPQCVGAVEVRLNSQCKQGWNTVGQDNKRESNQQGGDERPPASLFATQSLEQVQRTRGC